MFRTLNWGHSLLVAAENLVWTQSIRHSICIKNLLFANNNRKDNTFPKWISINNTLPSIRKSLAFWRYKHKAKHLKRHFLFPSAHIIISRNSQHSRHYGPRFCTILLQHLMHNTINIYYKSSSSTCLWALKGQGLCFTYSFIFSALHSAWTIVGGQLSGEEVAMLFQTL